LRGEKIFAIGPKREMKMSIFFALRLNLSTLNLVLKAPAVSLSD